MKIRIRPKPQPIDPLAEFLTGDRLGLVLDEPNDVYHATHAISKTKLDTFIEKPALYHGRYVTKTIERDESDALRIGAACHPLVLEGEEEFDKLYLVAPKVDKRTSAGKAEWELFQSGAKATGRKILSADDAKLIKGVAKAVRNNEIATTLLASCLNEVTMRVKLPWAYAQCRPDGYVQADAQLAQFLTGKGYRTDEGDIIVCDLKTTADALRDWVRRSFVGFNYHRSAPFYGSIIKDVLGSYPRHFFFIVVEKDEPQECGVFAPSEEASAFGWSEVTEGMNRLREAYATGVWPGFPEVIHTASLPVWKLKEGGAL